SQLLVHLQSKCIIVSEFVSKFGLSISCPSLVNNSGTRRPLSTQISLCIIFKSSPLFIFILLSTTKNFLRNQQGQTKNSSRIVGVVTMDFAHALFQFN